jgi:hypothetical protein
MKRDVLKATAWGLLVTLALAGLIVIGSRHLAHFDAALIGYTFAVLFAAFGITYRYAMWLIRPPTAVLRRRGWQALVNRQYLRSHLGNWATRAVSDIALNRFIWYRGRLRWLAHWLILWGCAIAVAITFPLVFGWLSFASVPGAIERYRIMVFGFSTFSFAVDSVFAFLMFHGLVWSAFLVIAGVMIAMRRRMRDEGAAAVQQFAEDFLPLIMLFAVSLTGLMLTVSYTWMKGYAYDFLAILHAITVILTLVWLPFGKFFHIFQRPAQIGIRVYKDVGQRDAPARCRRCDRPFTSRMHVEDLIQIERQLGYRYEMSGGGAEHYQWICPPCRRAMFALAQGRLWHGTAGEVATDSRRYEPLPASIYVNPGLGEGPLGEEDRRNFHP